ncbi:MAG: hypothetical protein MJA29_09780, partial [Candidatus Omnitrophica bacterium]|nr:hypothetical protein [Candidatus Omnitrophota bacterium]
FDKPAACCIAAGFLLIHPFIYEYPGQRRSSGEERCPERGNKTAKSGFSTFTDAGLYIILITIISVKRGIWIAGNQRGIICGEYRELYCLFFWPALRRV